MTSTSNSTNSYSLLLAITAASVAGIYSDHNQSDMDLSSKYEEFNPLQKDLTWDKIDQTTVTINPNSSKNTINKFAKQIITNNKDLESEIAVKLNEEFWDLL